MTSVSGDVRQRASDKLARLAGHGLDLVGFWRASTEALVSAVPHDGAPCWFTLDPASLLVTSHFDEASPSCPPMGAPRVLPGRRQQARRRRPFPTGDLHPA